MKATIHPAAPFEPELEAVLDVVQESLSPTLTLEDLPALRASSFTPSLDELLDGTAITHEERVIPGPEGAPDLVVSIFRRADQVRGGPAGAGPAAGIASMARDRSGPPLAAQILISGMLDEHNDTVSSRQVDGIGVWDHNSNDMGWTASLGDRRATDSVTRYESPSRATDLADLPPTYLEVGSVEVFRDEMVAYASALWAAGGIAELHVWPGGYHLFELLVPHAALSRAARETRTAWLRRTLATA